MDTTNWKVMQAPTCPHCGKEMEQMDSRHLEWDSPFLWVCFNNDCSLFKSGWEHMIKNYQQIVSYRFMIHPQNGEKGVIPAFSHDYIRQAGLPIIPSLEEEPESFELEYD